MQSKPNRLLLALCLLSVSLAAGAQTVLILHSYHQGYEWDASINRGMMDQLRLLPKLSIRVEYLDSLNHSGQAYLDSLANHLQLKYQQVKIDLILCSDDNAMNFLDQRPHLFRDSPIVFCGINNYQPGQFTKRPLLSGVNEAISARETLEMAIQFRPQARRILAVADAGLTAQRNFAIFEEALSTMNLTADKEIIRMQGVEADELAKALAQLSAEDIILYLGYLSTPGGQRFSVKESISLIQKNSQAAIFGMWDFLLPEGILGGHVVHGYSQGEAAANLARRILEGSPVQQLPVIMASPNRYAVNDTQMQKFGIASDLIPNDSLLYEISDQTFIQQWHAENRKSAFGYDLFENHTMTMLLIDPASGIILDANRAARLFYGYSTLVGMDIGTINTMSATEITAEMEKARASKKAYFQFRHRLADGTVRDVAIHSGPVNLNNKDLLFSVVQDISDRVRAETLAASYNRLFLLGGGLLLALAIIVIISLGMNIRTRRTYELQLRASEQKLSSLFEAMQELVVLHQLVFDGQGKVTNYRIIDCNRAFTEATGITRENAAGRLATEVYATEQAPYLEEFSAVALKEQSLQMETYFAPMDKHFKISVVATGKHEFATITSDISDLKRIQQSIAAKNKELEQIVYVASHDLRSPLINVDGYGRELEFILADIEASLAEESADGKTLIHCIVKNLPDMADALQHIRNSSKQMDRLLKGLLKLSRSGRAALTISRLDMNEVMARILASFDFQTKECGAQISCSDLPACRADPVQIDQIFSNLIGNAFKYRDKQRLCRINISGYTELGQAVYCVSDNGIGIAQEHQGNIFELFHRLDPAKSEGEGLGLTIVRQIVSRLEGSIRVESTIGTGTSFFVSLPLA